MSGFFGSFGAMLALAAGYFCLITLLHELGHYSVAKLFGVHAPTFSIGVGPRWLTYEKKKWQTSWRITPILCMGYAAMHAGETDDFGAFLERPVPKWICRIFMPVFWLYSAFLPCEEEEDTEGKLGVFDLRPWQRFLIYIAGPVANFISAFALLFILFLCYGENTFAVVTHGSFQNLAGMKSYYLNDGNAVLDALYNASVTVLLLIYVQFVVLKILLTAILSGHMPLQGAVEGVESASVVLQQANEATGGLVLPELCGIFIFGSVIIGASNLLPLPGLDGIGLIVEPLSYVMPKRFHKNLKHWIRLCGVLLIGVLFVYMLGRDLIVYSLRLFGG